MVWEPGEPRATQGVVLVQDEHGGHGGDGAFAGFDLVAAFGAEAGHDVVEQHAGAFGDDLGAVEAVEGVGVRDDVAGLIDDGEVGGVVRFVVVGAGGERGGFVEADALGPGFGVFLGDEAGGGDVEEGGVAGEFGAVAEGAAGGFDVEVAGLGGALFAEFEVEVFEDVEHLDDGGAAGTRWTHGEDGMTAVGALDGVAFDGFVGLEVVEGDGAVVGGHVFGDELGGLALVELPGAVLLEALEGGGEVGLFDDFALFQGRVGAVEEDFGGLREALHDGDLEGEDDLHALGGGEAVFGQEAGGFEDFGPFEFAELLVCEG